MEQEPPLIRAWVQETTQHEFRQRLSLGGQTMVVLGRSTQDAFDRRSRKVRKAEKRRVQGNLVAVYGEAYGELVDLNVDELFLKVDIPIKNRKCPFPQVIAFYKLEDQGWDQASAVIDGPSVAYLLQVNSTAALELVRSPLSYGILLILTQAYCHRTFDRQRLQPCKLP